MHALGFPGFGPNDTVTLGQQLSGAYAVANSVTRTIYLGDNFFASEGRQPQTVLHEILHLIFYNGADLSGDHLSVANALALEYPSIEDLRSQYPAGTPEVVLRAIQDQEASGAVDDFLTSNCGVPRN